MSFQSQTHDALISIVYSPMNELFVLTPVAKAVPAAAESVVKSSKLLVLTLPTWSLSNTILGHCSSGPSRTLRNSRARVARPGPKPSGMKKMTEGDLSDLCLCDSFARVGETAAREIRTVNSEGSML